MRVLIGAPELGVRDIDSAGQLLEQLLPRNLRAVVLLESGKQALLSCDRTREQPPILLGIEAPLGLELRRRAQPIEKSEARKLAQLVIADRNAAAPILLLQQHLHDHLVEDAVLYLTHPVLGQRAAGTLLLALELALDALVPIGVEDVAA